MTARIGRTESGALPPGWVWAEERELKDRYALPSAFEGMEHLVYERLKEN